MGGTRAKAERLFRRLPAAGCWLNLPCPEAAEVAVAAGADFGLVDCEHGVMSLETAGRLLAALKAGGVAALARPPEVSDAWVKRLLDAGAEGLILPMVESAARAADAVAMALFPPRGRRGVAATVVRAGGWGAQADAYVAGWNDRAFLAMQIESPAALDAAGAIAAVEGVDMLFFGPNDYGWSAGLGGAAHPDVFAAFRRVADVAHAAGKLVGTVAFQAGPAAALRAAGCDVISSASDVSALRRGVAAALAEARP
jgi:2-keto-3-deoxy-L-rhamnonate aldolase RhmA